MAEGRYAAEEEEYDDAEATNSSREAPHVAEGRQAAEEEQRADAARVKEALGTTGQSFRTHAAPAQDPNRATVSVYVVDKETVHVEQGELTPGEPRLNAELEQADQEEQEQADQEAAARSEQGAPGTTGQGSAEIPMCIQEATKHGANAEAQVQEHIVAYAQPHDTCVRPRIATRSASSTWMASRQRTQIGIPMQVPSQMNECISEVVLAIRECIQATGQPILSIERLRGF